MHASGLANAKFLDYHNCAPDENSKADHLALALTVQIVLLISNTPTTIYSKKNKRAERFANAELRAKMSENGVSGYRRTQNFEKIFAFAQLRGKGTQMDPRGL